MEVEAIVEPFRIHSGSFVPVKFNTILGDPLLPVVDTESSFWPLNIRDAFFFRNKNGIKWEKFPSGQTPPPLLTEIKKKTTITIPSP